MPIITHRPLLISFLRVQPNTLRAGTEAAGERRRQRRGGVPSASHTLGTSAMRHLRCGVCQVCSAGAAQRCSSGSQKV